MSALAETVMSEAKARAHEAIHRIPIEDVADDRIELLIELDAMAKELDAKLKATKSELERIGASVAEDFTSIGQQSVTRRGKTIYLRKEEWPKLVYHVGPGATEEEMGEAEARAKDALIEALANDPRTSHLVKASYNSQSLRSWMLNECPVDDTTMQRVIPDFLSGKMTVSEQFKVAVRKA